MSQQRLTEVSDNAADVPRALRQLRADGYPLDNDRKANWRLRKEPRGEPVNTDVRRITSKLRWQVLVRDKHQCQGCYKEVGQVAHDGRPVRLEVDHIIPWSKNGKTELSNLQTLCHVCNHGKKDSVPAFSTACLEAQRTIAQAEEMLEEQAPRTLALEL